MTLRVRLLAMLVGLAIAGGGVLIADRLVEDDETSRRGGDIAALAGSSPFSPVVSGQPQLPREIPGFETCMHPGPECAFVELTLERYAEIVGADPELYVHIDPDVAPCPRPEGPEEGIGEAPCRERPENLTVVLSLQPDAARAFIETYGCGRPVVDPCR